MLAKGLTPTDMVLLYAWAGAAGCRGLQLKAVSASLLATHFAKVGLKLQGPVPIAFLHRPLHMYLSSLNLLESVEIWLDAQPAARKRKPLVPPPRPRKLQVQVGSAPASGGPAPTQLPQATPPLLPAPLDPATVPPAPALAPSPPSSQEALPVTTLVTASQPSTPHSPPSRHGSPTKAAAQAVQHTLAMAARAVATVVDQAKEQIGHLTDLAAGHSAR